jgi:hypothetical protein
MGEKFVLIIIIRLLDEKQVITKNDVCLANAAKRDTTYHLILSLEKKGYLKSSRSKKFYSHPYITLLDRGLSFASKMKRSLLSVDAE